MSLRMKVKTYSFWVSLASAVILILKLVGQKFGFSVDEGLISDLFTSLCAILVILGIIVVPSSSNLEPKNNDIQKTISDKKVSEVVGVNESVGLIENKEYENGEEIIEEEIIIEDPKIEEPTENQKLNLVEISESDDISETFKEEIEQEISEQKERVNQIEEIKVPFVNLNIEEFIDKVCTKRAELNNNVANFVEFLQNELDNIKNNNK